MDQSTTVTVTPPSKASQLLLSIYVCFPLLHLSVASSQEEGDWKMPARLLTILVWLAVSSFLFNEHSTGYLQQHGQEIVLSAVILTLFLNGSLSLGVRADVMSIIMLSLVLATLFPRIRLDFLAYARTESPEQSSV